MLSLSSALLSVALSASALQFSPVSLPSEVPLGSWVPAAGDRFIVDVSTNVGYLVHTDASYISFPVATGKKEVVSYMVQGKRLTYEASTPAQYWVAKSFHKQPDLITFGPTGKFFRLYADGDTYTYYGIHGFAYEDEMFNRETRYQSMGCIIVKNDVLDVIEKTYKVNDGSLEVYTVDGLRGFPLAMESGS